MVAVVKGNPIEALQAFIAKATESLKKVQRDNLPPEVLAGLMKQ